MENLSEIIHKLTESQRRLNERNSGKNINVPECSNKMQIAAILGDDNLTPPRVGDLFCSEHDKVSPRIRENIEERKLR